MTTYKLYHLSVGLLLSIPLFMSAWKWNKGYMDADILVPDTKFNVEMFCSIVPLFEDTELFVKMYLPQSNQHQEILHPAVKADHLVFKPMVKKDIGKRGIWRGSVDEAENLSYSFQYRGKKMKYLIAEDLPFPQRVPDSLSLYMGAEEYIQSDQFLIKQLATELTQDKVDLKNAVFALYAYVHSMPSIKTKDLTDALTALINNGASCNGKSRLLVALCRAVGIPARTVGGIILETSQKRTSHLWVEIWMGGQWISFDPLNGHFASLPAHYLQLYYGDHFLITHTPGVPFDYNFIIKEEKQFLTQNSGLLTLWGLLSIKDVPLGLLKTILILPLCALIVGIFRNVVGLKTIGIFLPAIIAISLESIGLGFGMMAFALVIAVVGLLHFPLEKWGILHTPKLIIMLTAVVISLLSLSYLGILLGHQMLTAIIFFPIIVLTIAAEKFAKTIIEEGFQEALKLQAQTLLLTLICYPVFASDFMIGYLLTFPETYFLIIGLLLILGRWIGIRLTEYFRFKALVQN